MQPEWWKHAEVSCIVCGYSLAGLPTDGKCPECGQGIAEGKERARRELERQLRSHRGCGYAARRLGVFLACMAGIGAGLMWWSLMQYAMEYSGDPTAIFGAIPGILLVALGVVGLMRFVEKAHVDTVSSAVRGEADRGKEVNDG